MPKFYINYNSRYKCFILSCDYNEHLDSMIIGAPNAHFNLRLTNGWDEHPERYLLSENDSIKKGDDYEARC